MGTDITTLTYVGIFKNHSILPYASIFTDFSGFYI